MDDYGLTLVSGPAAEPLTAAEAQSWCRAGPHADLAELAALVTTARLLAEVGWSRQLLTATWRLTLPAFPCRALRVPLGPLQSVTSVQYVDSDGTLQTLSASRYEADSTVDPWVIQPAYGHAWPAARAVRQAVRITFTAGYGDAPSDVPEPIRQALRIAVAWWYERRGDEKEAAALELPRAVERLLNLYWNGHYA